MEEIRIEDYYFLAISKADNIYWKLVGSGISGIERNDLIQQALLGLVEARNNFDSERKAKFSTYAFHRINGAIIDFLRKEDYLPQEKREKLKKYERTREDIVQRLEREPTLKEIAKELKAPEEEVKKLERWRLSFVSLEEPCFTDNGIEANILDTIPSDIKPPDIVIEDEERNKAVDLCVEGLPSPEKEIIEQRYWKEKTLKEVARYLDMPLSTIQRKEKEAERRLRDCMEKKGMGPIK